MAKAKTSTKKRKVNVEAVGQAVGELYQLFQTQTETTDYSTNYQTQQGVDGDF